MAGLVRCGKPTKKGTPCQTPLNGGRCPTHDADLSKRNAAVRASFAERSPAAYAAHQRQAGRRGFIANGGKHGWEKAHERARLWRLENPSEPERWALSVLESAGVNHFTREYPVLEGHSLDIAWPDCRRAIEINGHQHKPAFGEAQPRSETRQKYKLEHLGADGWQILIIDATGDRAAAAAELLAFAQASQPAEDKIDGFEWSF
jgi:hypothetical protein